MRAPVRRVSYVFLCSVPVLDFVVGSDRALRIPAVHVPLGLVLFAAIVAAVRALGGQALGSGDGRRRDVAVLAALLLVPSSLVTLLWVGLGTPWEATPSENVMRYAVLVAGSIAVTCAFCLLARVLADTGERLWSTLGAAANVLAGAAYLVWTSFQLGAHVLHVRQGQAPPELVALGNAFDALLFVAGALTYALTAAFAESLRRTGRLGTGAARAYQVVSLAALAFLLARGLSYPDPTSFSTPWYMHVGFIVGIPAVPWIAPFLLGVLLLRRAGEEQA